MPNVGTMRRLSPQVLEWLRQEWTPEIIVAKLRMLFPRDCRMRVSVETIYQWVYANARAGGDWYRYLWRPRKQRRKQRNGLKKILIPNRTGIEERPSGANNRSRYGHWEGDTVEGRKELGGLTGSINHVSTEVEKYPGSTRTPEKRPDSIRKPGGT